MVRRVAVAWAYWRSPWRRARALRPGLQGHPRRRVPPPPKHSRSSTDRPRKRDRRRRRSSATLDCGLCRPARCSATANGPVSVYRRGTNYIQGYTNVADFAGTFAVGIKNRAEIFGSFLVRYPHRSRRPADLRHRPDVRRLHRSLSARQSVPGPATTSAISTSARKFNFWSRGRPEAGGPGRARHDQAADRRQGRWQRHRQTDVSVDCIVSKEAAKVVEVSGFGGYEFRGKPDGFDTPTGAFRWGAGVGFPSRNWLRVTGELNGYVPSTGHGDHDDPHLVGDRWQPVAPLVSTPRTSRARRWASPHQTKNGCFIGARRELERAVEGARTRRSARTTTTSLERLLRLAVPDRLSPGRARLCRRRRLRHRRRRRHRPRRRRTTLTVKAECNPCTVEVGRDVDGHGDRAGFDRLRGHLSLDARRPARSRSPRERSTHLDRAAAAKARCR